MKINQYFWSILLLPLFFLVSCTDSFIALDPEEHTDTESVDAVSRATASYKNALQLPGSAVDIAYGGGKLFCLGTENNGGGGRVYKWENNWWQVINGEAVRIAVDKEGKPWVVNKSGYIYKGDGNGGWSRLPDKAKDIGIGGDNQVYIIGYTNTTYGGYIYKWNGSGWSRIHGEATRVAVDRDGKPWVVNTLGDTFKGDGAGNWTHLPGKALDIGIGPNGTVFTCRSNSGSLYEWNGSNWSTRLTMEKAISNVTVGYNGVPYWTAGDERYMYKLDRKLRTIAVTLHGASAGSEALHDLVRESASEVGIYLVDHGNWIKDEGDAVASDDDAKRIRDKINRVADRSGGKGNIKLVIVGKSAGGVLAWKTLRTYWSEMDDFKRISLLLIDPHGRATNDGESSAYDEYTDLTWPGSWSTDKNYFRVYNVHQKTSTVSGAAFPSPNVYQDTLLTGSVSHDNIISNEQTRSMMRSACSF